MEPAPTTRQDSLGKVTKSYATDYGTLDYEGFFCWSNNVTKAGDYVVSRGKMYHLTSRWENLTGTMWLLRDRTKNNALSFDFGDGQTTDRRLLKAHHLMDLQRASIL